MAKILLLEDSLDMQNMLKALLEMEGHRVVCANSGAAGLRFLNGTPTLPDVVITDRYMPELDGLEFLRAARSDGRFRGIRIIIMSAEGVDLDALKRDGANAFMLKPLDLDRFQLLLQKWGLA